MVSKHSPKQEEGYVNTNISYKEDTLTSIELLNSNNNYGAKCSDIYKDYFYFENKNLKELAEKLGISPEGIPDSISKINLYELLYVSKDTRKSISDRYFKAIDSSLDKDNFTADKNTEITVNGKDIKADGYTLSMDSEDFYDVLLSVFETLKDDDEALDLLVEKVKILSANTDSVEISKDNLKTAVDELITSLEEAKDSNSSASGEIEITVYESKGKTVKIEIALGGEIIGLDITKNKKDGIISLYIEADNEVAVCVKNEYTIDDDTTTGKITFTVSDKDCMFIDYTYLKSKSKISLDAKLYLSDSLDTSNIDFPDISKDFSIIVKYEITGDNLDKKPTKFDTNAYIKFVLDENTDYVQLNLKSSTQYSDSVEIPSLDDSNGVCLNTVTDTELETIKTEVNTNLNTFIDKILTKLDLTRSEAGISENSTDLLEKIKEVSPSTNDSNTTSVPNYTSLKQTINNMPSEAPLSL